MGSNQFKVGDKVVCKKGQSDVGTEFNLITGGVYEVIHVHGNGIKLRGYTRTYSADRFDLYVEEPKFPSLISDDVRPIDQTWADAAIKDTNPKTAFGIQKPSMSSIPPASLLHLAKAMSDGRRKYGLMNWRGNAVASSIYFDAAMRHLWAWYDGQNEAEDSQAHHLGHAMACLAIILDAEATGNLIDDRPKPGKFAELCKEMTAK